MPHLTDPTWRRIAQGTVEIDRIAGRSRRTFFEVTQDPIQEALRMREYPGIYFADELRGREANVV